MPSFESAGYRVHTPTLLGHGAAPRRHRYQLNDFRDHLLGQLDDLQGITVLGNSLGAFVASTIAVAQPDRVERLVLEELPVPPRDTTDSPPTVRAMPGAALAVAGWLGRKKCDPRLLRDVVGELRQPRPDWWEGLAAVKAPTLLLAGGSKSHLDQSRFELVADVLPNATLQTIDAGHRVHTYAPEPWLRAVLTFLL
ncbi:alpha/beta hydrolase [Kribbella sp. NPDC026611]|uniref:alpha/beta fold hydrolase n=1 Tax=Kribbella sp. NPDC026611 TaxID=3154911 RepID=UPI0033FB6508